MPVVEVAVVVGPVADRVEARRANSPKAVNVDRDRLPDRVAASHCRAIPVRGSEPCQLGVECPEGVVIDGPTAANADVVAVRADRDILVAQHRVASAQDGDDVPRRAASSAGEARGGGLNFLKVRSAIARGLEA